MHLLVQLVLNIYQALVSLVDQVELQVCLYAKKHFEIECELISHALLVGHIDLKFFDIFSDKRFCYATPNHLFVLFPIDESSKSLIEVDKANVHIFRELVLIQQLYALCLSVDIREALLDLPVQIPFAVRADFSEVIFLNAFEQ